jgi:transcriptional regulator with XRE-family HTH domain
MRRNYRIDKKKTAELLEQVRRTKGLTQAELSRQTKVSQEQISRILKGTIKRPAKGLDSLCAYLGVKIVMRSEIGSLSEYPELADCLSEVLDGSRRRERALIRLVKSARTLA